MEVVVLAMRPVHTGKIKMNSVHSIMHHQVSRVTRLRYGRPGRPSSITSWWKQVPFFTKSRHFSMCTSVSFTAGKVAGA